MLCVCFLVLWGSATYLAGPEVPLVCLCVLFGVIVPSCTWLADGFDTSLCAIPVKCLPLSLVLEFRIRLCCPNFAFLSSLDSLEVFFFFVSEFGDF